MEAGDGARRGVHAVSAALLLLVAAIYCSVAIDYAMSARYGMALAWAAYALANIGFAWDAR